MTAATSRLISFSKCNIFPKDQRFKCELSLNLHNLEKNEVKKEETIEVDCGCSSNNLRVHFYIEWPTLSLFMLPVDLHFLKSVGCTFLLVSCFLRVCAKIRTTPHTHRHMHTDMKKTSLHSAINSGDIPHRGIIPWARKMCHQQDQQHPFKFKKKKSAVIYIIFVICSLDLYIRSYFRHGAKRTQRALPQ